MKKIGFITGSFKPYTIGHEFLFNKASKECDLVNIFISIQDRKRPKEIPITWVQMKKIWDQYIIPKLPNNIVLHFTNNPTVSLFNFLCEQDLNNYSCYVYSDSKDINYINSDRVRNKLPLSVRNNLYSVPVDRQKHVNVSSTYMRKIIQNNDYKTFVKLLPISLVKNHKDIYQILKGN